MRIISTIVEVFALLLLLIATTNSDDFCEEFAKNNYRISYGFHQITIGDTKWKPFVQSVYIGQRFWRLTFEDSPYDEKKVVSIATTTSETSDWFGNQYSMAFCVWFVDHCETALVNSAKTSVDWKRVNNDDMKVSEDSVSVTQPLDLKGLNAYIAFVPNWGQKEYKFVIFFQQKPKVEYKIYLIGSDMSVKDGEAWKSVIRAKEHYKVQPKGLIDLLELRPDLEVAAIFGQYSYANYETHGRFWGHGMIILFYVNKELQYCYTSTEGLNETSYCRTKLKRLECTVVSGTGKPETANDMTIVIAIIAIIAIIVLILIIVWFYCSYILKRSEEDTRVPSMAQATARSAFTPKRKPSQTSSPKKSSVAK